MDDKYGNILVAEHFYWIKFPDSSPTIGKWDGRHFSICGSDEIVRYSEVSEVSPVVPWR